MRYRDGRDPGAWTPICGSDENFIQGIHRSGKREGEENRARCTLSKEVVATQWKQREQTSMCRPFGPELAAYGQAEWDQIGKT